MQGGVEILLVAFLPLPTQVYKWVPAKLTLGIPYDGLASYAGGSRNTPSRFFASLHPGI